MQQLRSLFRGHGERPPARTAFRNGSRRRRATAFTPRSIRNLQRAAAEAVQIGVRMWTSCWPSATRSGRKRASPVPQAQIALVAMDPHTGEIRALDRRPRLRREPAESRARPPAAGFGVQAVRVCGGFDNAVQGLAAGRDSGNHRGRRADDIPIRRQGIHAE